MGSRTGHAAPRVAAIAAGAILCALAGAPQHAHAQLRGGLPPLGGGLGPYSGPSVGGLGLPDASNRSIGLPDSVDRSIGRSAPRFPDLPGASLPRAPDGVTDRIGRTRDDVGNTLGGRTREALPKRLAQPSPARAPGWRSGVPAAGERRFLPDEVVVSFPAGVPPQTAETIARRHGLTPLQSQTIALTGRTAHRWRIADGRAVSDVIRAIEAETGVSAAQPNYRFRLQDRNAAQAAHVYTQYALDKLQIARAHRLSVGNGAPVAIIDSGVDANHPELADALAGSFDALNSTAGPDAHGTAIAGVIVARARLRGIAPAARILAIRAFDGTGRGEDGTTLTILRALDWAVARGARVINMSFAGPPDPDISAALDAARKKGIVLVAAAGNAGPRAAPLYPAADPNVIAVTATDVEDRLFAGANRGRHIAIAAPGVEVLLPAPGGTYQLLSGTSIAAAHITGVIALLLEPRPGLAPETARSVLTSSAKDLGPKGRDDMFGAGLADSYRSILALDAQSMRDAPRSALSAR